MTFKISYGFAYNSLVITLLNLTEVISKGPNDPIGAMSSSVVVAADVVLSLSSIHLSHKLAADKKNSLLIQAMKIMASFIYLTSLSIVMLVMRYAFWYSPPGAKPPPPTNNANRNHYLPLTSKVFSY